MSIAFQNIFKICGSCGWRLWNRFRNPYRPYKLGMTQFSPGFCNTISWA